MCVRAVGVCAYVRGVGMRAWVCACVRAVGVLAYVWRGCVLVCVLLVCVHVCCWCACACAFGVRLCVHERALKAVGKVMLSLLLCVIGQCEVSSTHSRRWPG